MPPSVEGQGEGGWERLNPLESTSQSSPGQIWPIVRASSVPVVSRATRSARLEHDPPGKMSERMTLLALAAVPPLLVTSKACPARSSANTWISVPVRLYTITGGGP